MNEIPTGMKEWMKAIAHSVEVVDKKIDKGQELNITQHNELAGKIDNGHAILSAKHDKLREEFIIHKTKINTKTYMISAMIGFVVTIITLTITILNNNKNNNQEAIPTQTTMVIHKQV